MSCAGPSSRRAEQAIATRHAVRATGELRPDLSDDDVADLVWSMNGPEYWSLLVGDRGWTPQRFADRLVDAWRRLLLATPDARPPAPQAEPHASTTQARTR
jgi:hypothetical protein